MVGHSMQNIGLSEWLSIDCALCRWMPFAIGFGSEGLQLASALIPASVIDGCDDQN